METVEEVRAVRMVRAACADLNLAAFEWTIASGLARCGGGPLEAAIEGSALASARDLSESATALYDSREPAKMLANLEGISIEAAFILKDLHRHMDDSIVVRRLRDVGQKFATNRRTVILTAPKISIPPELANLVEFLELPLPERPRLRQIIDEVLARISKTHTLERRLAPPGLDAMADHLRGLTEEEAERAISQALVTRYALCPETVTDVLEAKKTLLKRFEMLDAKRALPGETDFHGLLESVVVSAPGFHGLFDCVERHIFGDGALREGGELGVRGETQADDLAECQARVEQSTGEDVVTEILFGANGAVLRLQWEDTDEPEHDYQGNRDGSD